MRGPAGARKVRWSRPGTPPSTPDPFAWEDTTPAARLRRLVAFRRADVAPAVVGLATIAYTVFAIVLGPAQPPGLPHSGRSAGAPGPSYILVPTSGPDQSPTGSSDPTADPTAAEGAAGQPTASASGPAGAIAGPDATHGTTPTTGPSRSLATNPAVAGPTRATTTPDTPVHPSPATTAPSATTASSATTSVPTASRPLPTSTSRDAATTATVAPVVSVTTTSPRDVPGGGAVGGGVTTGTLQPGSTISLRATTACCTGRFVRRQAGQLATTAITPSSARSDKNDATWVVRPGLADPSCLSFESGYAAGTFLRHSFFRVHGQTTDGTALFRADATFCPTKGKNGQGTSFASYNYPTKFLRHYNHQLYIAGNGGSNAWDSSALWADDVSWVVTSPWGS